MKRPLTSLLLTFLTALGTSAVEATPYTLDFEVSTSGSSPEDSGDWSFAGGVGTPLVGSGIEVDGLLIVEAPLSSGATGESYAILNGSLDFTTGGFTGATEAGPITTLDFDGGGVISLTGTIDVDGDGTVSAGDFGTDLLVGEFNTAMVMDVDGICTMTITTFFDSTNDDLERHIDIATDFVWSGTFNISFQHDGLAADYSFSSTRTLSGDIVNTVPEPVTVLLLGIGSLGFGLLARRRRRRTH